MQWGYRVWDQVVDIARSYSEGLGKIKEDTMRNLFIYRKENSGRRPIVQLMLTVMKWMYGAAIRPNGCLQIIPIGSWVT